MRNKFRKLIYITLIFMMIMSLTGFANETRALSDMVSLFRNIQIEANDEVYGSAVAIFGNVQVDGKVNGDVVSVFGNTRINGTVTGTVVTVIGGVNISSGGVVQTDVVQVLGGRINDEPGSQIWGSRVGISTFGLPGVTGVPLLIILILLFTVVKLIIGYVMSVIAIMIFPKKFENMSDWASIDISRRFLIGILVVVSYYVVIALLLMVVVGVPFVLLIIPIMILLGFTGNTAVKLAIGKRIGKSMGKNFSQMLSLFVGTLAYAIVDLTIIGKSATFVARTIGIGAVIDSSIGSKNPFSPTKMGFINLEKKDDE